MADDTAVALAEAVKDALNAGTYSQEFTAARAYDLTAELQDDGVLHVDVGIRRIDGEIANRSEADADIEIDVVVRKKCDVDDIEKLDALMLLVLELRDVFFAKRLTTPNGKAWCAEYARKPAYFQNHLRQFRQFTAPLTLTFNATEPLS